MNVIPLTIESLVAMLLLLTILYCVRLNSQLKRLKADEAAMTATIAELLTATETAERAIAGLKTTVREADETLGEKLRAAERMSADALRAQPAGRVAPFPARTQAGTPDPKAIMAAAQAFTDRARARLGAAA